MHVTHPIASLRHTKYHQKSRRLPLTRAIEGSQWYADLYKIRCARIPFTSYTCEVSYFVVSATGRSAAPSIGNRLRCIYTHASDAIGGSDAAEICACTVSTERISSPSNFTRQIYKPSCAEPSRSEPRSSRLTCLRLYTWQTAAAEMPRSAPSGQRRIQRRTSTMCRDKSVEG